MVVRMCGNQHCHTKLFGKTLIGRGFQDSIYIPYIAKALEMYLPFDPENLLLELRVCARV